MCEHGELPGRKSTFLLRGKAGKSMLTMNKYIDDPITDYYIKALDMLVEEKTAKKRTREEMEKPMADEAYRLSRAKLFYRHQTKRANSH